MPVTQESVSIALERILLATDFSASSKKAGAYAAAVARRFGSKLEIAHVFDPSVVTSYEEAIVAMPAIDRKRIADENLKDFAYHLHLDGIRTSLFSTEGHRPAATILDIAGEHRADLIVTGTEAKSGITRLILGSTSERILRSAVCPVLTVGPMATTPSPDPLVFRDVIYATDFSLEAARAARLALFFAEESNAHLFCCAVLSRDDEALKPRHVLHEAFSRRLRDMLPESAFDWCSPECVVEYGKAASAILSLAARVKADLIVLGARRSSFWLTHVEGGLTPALLADATCPILTIS